MNLLFLALLSLILGFPVFEAHVFAAAEPLSLEQAMSEAKGHSPAYIRMRAAADAAGWHKLDVLSANLPKFGVTASHFFEDRFEMLTIPFGGQTVSFPAIYPLTTVSLDANWTVFDGLTTPFAYNAARLNARAADLELEYAGLALESDIRLKFYQALAAQQLAGVAEQNLKTLREHMERAGELLKRGKATRFDTLRVSVQLEEAEPELAQANDNVITSRRELAAAMGLESDDRRMLKGSLPVPQLPQTLAQLASNPAERSDIQALIERADAAGDMSKATLGQWVPKVAFVANRTFYNNVNNNLNFTSDQAAHTAYNIGVVLTWNIFDGGASIARERQAAYEAEMAEQRSRASLLHAPIDVDKWRRRLIYSESLYRARLRAIEAAQESVRLARLSYNAGTRTSTDVLDSELDLFRARAGVVNAQIEAVQSKINLELALGRKI